MPSTVMKAYSPPVTPAAASDRRPSTPLEPPMGPFSFLRNPFSKKSKKSKKPVPEVGKAGPGFFQSAQKWNPFVRKLKAWSSWPKHFAFAPKKPSAKEPFDKLAGVDSKPENEHAQTAPLAPQMPGAGEESSTRTLTAEVVRSENVEREALPVVVSSHGSFPLAIADKHFATSVSKRVESESEGVRKTVIVSVEITSPLQWSGPETEMNQRGRLALEVPKCLATVAANTVKTAVATSLAVTVAHDVTFPNDKMLLCAKVKWTIGVGSGRLHMDFTRMQRILKATPPLEGASLACRLAKTALLLTDNLDLFLHLAFSRQCSDWPALELKLVFEPSKDGEQLFLHGTAVQPAEPAAKECVEIIHNSNEHSAAGVAQVGQVEIASAGLGVDANREGTFTESSHSKASPPPLPRSFSTEMCRTEQTSGSADLIPSPPRRKKSRPRIGPYRLSRVLGQGSAGHVYLGTHCKTGEQVATKVISRHGPEGMSDVERSQHRKRTEQEICVMELLGHPNVLRLHDVYETLHERYLILELVSGGDLFDYLGSRGCLPEREALEIFRQICFGVQYCHKNSVCHRDLKPENILLDANGIVKIADFGMGTMSRPGHLLADYCGTPQYASPEVIKGVPYDGFKADLWSVGVILYVLLTDTLPFGGQTAEEIMDEVQMGIFLIPSFVPVSAADLIGKLLVADPAKRLTMEGILSHTWFTSSTSTALVHEEAVSVSGASATPSNELSLPDPKMENGTPRVDNVHLQPAGPLDHAPGAVDFLAGMELRPVPDPNLRNAPSLKISGPRTEPAWGGFEHVLNEIVRKVDVHEREQ